MDTEKLLDGLFQRLVVGLRQYIYEQEQGGTGVPYPATLQHALNQLSVLITVNGENYPSNFFDVLKLFEKPLIKWWIWFDKDFVALPNPSYKYLNLLWKGALTQSIEDYLIDSKLDLSSFIHRSAEALEQELDQAVIGEMVNLVRSNANKYQHDYVETRKFIIQNPYVFDEVFVKFKRSLTADFADRLARSYEPNKDFHLQAYYDSSYWACPHCNGILNWVNGLPRCAQHDICGWITDDYKNRKPLKPDPYQTIWRLKHSIHTRTCIPGIPELELYNELKRIYPSEVLDIELWIGGDQYDLELQFKDEHQTRWAVDVKDVENPYFLASKIDNDFRTKQLPVKRNFGWGKFFYVIPEYRTRLDENYTKRVKEKYELTPILDIEQFLWVVHKQVGL